MRLSPDDFAELVEEALADIPEPFRGYMGDITVDIERMPDRRTASAAGVRNPRLLLGLYRGVPLTERSVEHARLPDRITIFQRNLERMCRRREDIIREVRRTVFHEVGHHFGLDEDDLDELGY